MQAWVPKSREWAAFLLQFSRWVLDHLISSGVGLCTRSMSSVVQVFKKGLLNDQGPALRAWSHFSKRQTIYRDMKANGIKCNMIYQARLT